MSANDSTTNVDPQAVRGFIEDLMSSDDSKRCDVYITVSSLASEVKDRALDILKVDDALRKQVVGVIVTDLRSEDFYLRRNAASALGMIGDIDAVDPLIAALADKSTQDAAAGALGQLKDVRAVAPLMSLLKENTTLDAARTACFALGYIGVPAFKPLLSLLEDDDEDMRSYAARGLGIIRDARAVDRLILALEDESQWVRSAAADALGEIPDERAVMPLIKLMQDDGLEGLLDDQERSQMALSRRSPWAESWKYTNVSRKGWARTSATKALGEIGGVRARDALITALSDEALRCIAAQALGKLGDSEAIDALYDMYGTRDQMAVWNAANAIHKISPEMAKERRVVIPDDPGIGTL